MAYSRWTTSDELKNLLSPISYDSDIKKSGIPMMYDEKHLYIKDGVDNTLVIGSTGSGKTQTLLLPQLRLAIKANESFIVHDVKGEIYNNLSGELKKRNYNTIVINLDDPNTGNSFNPLTLPYKLYTNNKKDDALELLENIGYYLCCDESYNNNVDPFWTNSAVSLFVGLALYLFDNADIEEINLNSILNLTSDFDKISEIMKNYDKTSMTYIYLSNIVLAPPETKGSILAVFIQNIKLFVSKEALPKMLSITDFDIYDIKNKNTAVFIISNNKLSSKKLIPLIIDEFYFAAASLNDKNNRLNILIDDFENLVPIKNFSNMLSLSRSHNINFNIYIRSLLELKNVYGKEEAEILKMVFSNIIYLLANDFETLEEISKLCGNINTDNGLEALISTDELKTLQYFEAIILIPRYHPIRTKLIPDYKIDWKFSDEKVGLNKNNNIIKIYNINK